MDDVNGRKWDDLVVIIVQRVVGLTFVFVVSPLNDLTKYLPEQQSCKKEKRKKERHNRRLDPPTLRRDTAGKKWNLSMFDWYSITSRKEVKE